MMIITLPFNKNKLQNKKFTLIQSDWDNLSSLFKEPVSIFIYEDAPIEEVKLLTVGKTLEAEGKALMRLHVYHSCQDYAVEIKNNLDNIPNQNNRCHLCKKKYGKNLRFDIELITKYAINLI